MDIGVTKATGLHARKKIARIDPESQSKFYENESKSKPKHTDVANAIRIIVFFVFFSVFLAYSVIHHHHTKVLHVMRDPVGHLVLKGRVGFRHHFYSNHPRSITVVLPSVVNPKGRQRRLDSIFETWGPNARAVYVAHNVSEFPQADPHAVYSDTSKPEDPYSYPQILLVPPNIGFDDGVPRLIYVIRSVYEKINPDFAFFVNDHTFVIPEHLCKYLEDKNPTDQMYHGHALKNQELVFNSGAAGYILSRQTMKSLVEKWDEGNPTCLAKNAPSWLQNNPGLVTTKCMKEELDLMAVDTRHLGKYHRFHAFPLTRSVSGDVDGWYEKKHVGMDELIATDESYNTLLSGADCCARDTISFHYVEYMESRALFATREALLKNPHMTDHELMHMMIAEWPHTQKDVGGYSRGLPKEGEERWKPLLELMRKISSRHTQREC